MKKFFLIIIVIAFTLSGCQKNELEGIELVDPEVLTNPAFKTSELYAYHDGPSSALEWMRGGLNIDPSVITDPRRIASVGISIDGNPVTVNRINAYIYTFQARVSPFITYTIRATINDSQGGTIKGPSFIKIYIPRS